MPERTGKWSTLALVACGVFMATLDSSIVNISLPAIAHYFAVPLSGTVEWVIIAYLVMLAAMLLNGGRLADIRGQKPIWALGLSIFTVGSVLCGLSPGLWWLIGARAVQAVGGALLLAIAPAMLTAAFPPEELGRAMGWNAVAVGVGISAGPVLGGVLTQHLSWRWIFFVNVPVGIAAVWATLRFLVERQPRQPARIDYAGAALLALGLAALTLGLSFGQSWGWGSPLLIAVLAVAVIALVAVVPVERRVQSPVVDLSLFERGSFTSAAVGQVTAFLAIFAVPFLLPFYLVELRGLDLQSAGLILTPVPLVMMLLGPTAGSLADRFGSRGPRMAGMSITAIALWLIAGFDAVTSIPRMLEVLVVLGVGQVLFFSANNRALMVSAPSGRRGVASGILATARAMGQSTSVALAGAIFVILGGSRAGRLLTESRIAPGGRAALEAAFVHAFRAALLVAAAIALLTVAIAWVKEPRPQPKTH